MSDTTRKIVSQPSKPHESGILSVIVRLFWMAIGNAALFILAVIILQRQRWLRLFGQEPGIHK